MKKQIALAGNPNCGKTTLFNRLTGSSHHVGNWPGVTVEKKAGKLKGYKDVDLVDLPGIYALSPYTLEEVVARDYLLDQRPDAIINIVDASNIERNLYLTTQILEIGIPVVVALNMMDVVRKEGDRIDVRSLSQALGCPVVETSALRGEGTQEVIAIAVDLAQGKRKEPPIHTFSDTVEQAINDIAALLGEAATETDSRWYAIKLFERDQRIAEKIPLSAATRTQIEIITSQCEEVLDDDSETIMTDARYELIDKIIRKSYKKANIGNVSTSDKIDRILTNRILALPLFAVMMFLVYFISVSTLGAVMTDWTNDVLFGAIISPAIESFLVYVGAAAWLVSLIIDGIVAGIGAVLGFLPQMLLLFLILAFLEDCGYMARVAFIMDRLFRKFGLSGKSFIPMLIATGCGVPAIMASRTIENERDRKLTIMTTTFMPCGAKLPMIALIVGALFPDSIWIAPSAYFLGIGAIVLSGIMLKKIKNFAGEPAPFIMELPPYHMPGAKTVFKLMWERGISFVKKAGTIIFIASALIWFLSNFGWTMQMVAPAESILADIGNAIVPVFAPLGWGDWKAAVATLSGLIAKENVVATFGILYGFEEVAGDGAEMWPTIQAAFTQFSGLSFLVFNLLCAPCAAAIGAMHREMGNAKWTLIAVAYQTGFAYVIALIVYQLGTLFIGGAFGLGTLAALICTAFLIFMVVRPYHNNGVK